MMYIMNIGTAELRNRLSYFLKQVRRGRRVVVLDRGQPVAELVPFTSEAQDLGGRIAEMSREALVTARPVRERQTVRPTRLHRADVRAARLVSEMRGER